jgi:pyruvate kinase
LAKIAAATEAKRPPARLRDLRALCLEQKPTSVAEAIASVVEHALETVPAAAVFVPTRTGTTARMISRFKPSAWIAAICPDPCICQGLAFSYGVEPIQLAQDPADWRSFAKGWLGDHQLPGFVAVLVAGPSPRHPDANHRIEFMRVGDPPKEVLAP